MNEGELSRGPLCYYLFGLHGGTATGGEEERYQLIRKLGLFPRLACGMARVVKLMESWIHHETQVATEITGPDRLVSERRYPSDPSPKRYLLSLTVENLSS